MEHKQEFLIVGKTDIEKAIYLLREIDAFLSFNISPPPAQMTEMRKTIQEFTSHFPECWKCGDTGYAGTGYNGDQKCDCVRSMAGKAGLKTAAERRKSGPYWRYTAA